MDMMGPVPKWFREQGTGKPVHPAAALLPVRTINVNFHDIYEHKLRIAYRTQAATTA